MHDPNYDKKKIKINLLKLQVYMDYSTFIYLVGYMTNTLNFGLAVSKG